MLYPCVSPSPIVKTKAVVLVLELAFDGRGRAMRNFGGAFSSPLRSAAKDGSGPGAKFKLKLAARALDGYTRRR